MLAPNISNVGNNAHVIKKTYGGTSNSIKATNNADGDAAVEIIQNPLGAYKAGIQQNVQNANAMSSQVQIFKDALADIEGKIAEMREPNTKLLTKKFSPMAMSPEEIKAIIEEMLAKTKKLWEVKMPSGSDIERDAPADVEGKMAEKRDLSVKLLTKEFSPMTLGYKEAMAATMDEIAAKMKELWKVEMPSGSDVERDRANLNLTL